MSELSDACAARGITLTFEYMYLEKEDRQLPWDMWKVSLHMGDRCYNYPGEYQTGIAHRTLRRSVERVGSRYFDKSGAGTWAKDATEACEEGMLVLDRKNCKLVGPDVADVLSCFLSDAQAGETTFDEWCSDLGYNNDSMKDAQTYFACQRTYMGLILLLGQEAFTELLRLDH